ncbi:MAG: hypothetical protein ACYC5G_05245 [Candidatus Doudnabacteria bacterium]
MEYKVQIPDGYEFDHMAPPILSNGGGCLNVILKKKNVKNFDFYVDEYLRADCNTTSDMLCNWMTSFEIDDLKGSIKQNSFQFIPWEVKIGLVKFMVKDMGLSFGSALFNVYNPNVNSNTNEKLIQICPVGFLESIIK